jgi:hypothetical protein
LKLPVRFVRFALPVFDPLFICLMRRTAEKAGYSLFFHHRRMWTIFRALTRPRNPIRRRSHMLAKPNVVAVYTGHTLPNRMAAPFIFVIFLQRADLIYFCASSEARKPLLSSLRCTTFSSLGILGHQLERQ